MATAGSSTKLTRLVSVDFEIFGRVQGVFFRKYTQKTAKKYGLVGWVLNTYDNSVQGHMQGREDHINEMKTWLRKTGSPRCRIDRAVFSNQKYVEKLTFGDFVVKR